jgi:predicted ATPase
VCSVHYRQELHAEIARVLEKQFPDAKDRQPELLAHHLTAAGLPEPAISYWLKAAKRAALRSAYQEALIHLDEGTALLGGLPTSNERLAAELQLQLQRDTAGAADQ